MGNHRNPESDKLVIKCLLYYGIVNMENSGLSDRVCTLERRLGGPKKLQ